MTRSIHSSHQQPTAPPPSPHNPPFPPLPPPPSPAEPVANVTISVKCRTGAEEIRPAGRRKAATVYSHPFQRKPPDDTSPRLGPGPRRRRHRHCHRHAAELPIPIPLVPGAAGSSAVGGNLSEIMPRLPMLRCLCVQVLKKLKRRVLVLMNSLPRGFRQGGVCYAARSSFGMFLKW